MIKLTSKLARIAGTKINSFQRSDGGNLLITAGILMPAVMLGCALAVEYSMASRLSSKVQNVADAALMAAAIEVRKLEDLDDEDLVKDELERHFEDYFIANMGNSLPPEFKVAELDYDTDTNRVRTVVSYQYTHSFYNVTGQGYRNQSHNQWIESEIGLTKRKKQPLSMIMVLDKSGSMGWDNRMQSLKTAVANMSATLTESDPDEEYVRTGVVFYDTRTTSLTVGWGSDDTNQRVQATHAGGGTDSSVAMRRAVNHLYGNHEEQKHSERNSGSPRKVILFLTDGNNNRPISDTKTISSCDKAKMNNRIEMYTIAFEAPVQGQRLLSNCASSAEHYFHSRNSAELIAAFEKIAESESGQLAFSK